jgi:CheY-like chemotaxis protein
MDVIDTKQLQERIRELEKEIETLKNKEKTQNEKNVAFSDFLALLTHKILTPMNSIIGMSRFLAESNLDNSQKHLVSKIRQSGIHLVDIYNEILDYTQADQPEKEPPQEEFDIRESLNNVVDEYFANNYMTKYTQIFHTLSPELNFRFKGDRARFEQIILLTLGEPQQDGIKRTIRIEVVKSEKREGAGITTLVTHQPAVLSNQHIQALTANRKSALFTNESSESGLFKFMFAKKNTEMNHGSFVVQKGEDMTQFQVRFPLEPIADEEISDRKTMNIPEFTGMQCLIVVANIAHQKHLQTILHQWGIRVFTANSEKDAIYKIIRERELHFIIISDQLPDVSPKRLARKIKSLPGKTEMPLILLENEKSFLQNTDYFIEKFQSTENKGILFEKLIKNIGQGKIQKTMHKLDSKLAQKLPLNILVAEDDAANLDLLMLLLKKLGYVPEVAKNGKEAMAMFNPNRFDMVLLDIQMPLMDGFKVAKKMLEIDPKVNIIAISANTLPETIKKAKNTGMVDFVTKPISFKKIEESIIQWGFAEKMLKKH